MKMRTHYLLTLLLPFLLLSCGEELVSKGTLSDYQNAPGIITMSSEECGGFHFEKPPVDILYVIDNSGSTNNNRFAQIKGQIANTINLISQDFDYHIYIAPLFGNESLSSYPLVVSDIGSLTNPGSYNIQSIENLNIFSTASGNNYEPGFDRAQNLINHNKSSGSINKIFRKNSNLIVVMISTGDDNSFCGPGLGNCAHPASQAIFNQKEQAFYDLKNDLNSEVFRFISLVPFSNCSPFKQGVYYREMSKRLYLHEGLTDDPTYKDSRNLCSGNYASLFQAVNNSIQKVLVGHTYDHWVINPNNVAINEDNILLTRKSTGTNIPQNNTNGFTYINYQVNKNTRILPTPGEPKTGLMVRLNGNAKVTYPDCIISKTKTPTEYYGYVALTRKPDLSTVKVEINGNEISQSGSNGWTSHNSNLYTENLNIKVPPGPVSPPLYQSGYFLKLNGSAVYSNSDTIKVYYKPADL